MKHPEPRTTGLIGPVYQLDTGETFQWSDPDRVPYKPAIGAQVVILTDEGGLRHGRRRWFPGAVGVVVAKPKHHDLGFTVLVNGHRALLFSDELEPHNSKETQQ